MGGGGPINQLKDPWPGDPVSARNTRNIHACLRRIVRFSPAGNSRGSFEGGSGWHNYGPINRRSDEFMGQIIAVDAGPTNNQWDYYIMRANEVKTTAGYTTGGFAVTLGGATLSAYNLAEYGNTDTSDGTPRLQMTGGTAGDLEDPAPPASVSMAKIAVGRFVRCWSVRTLIDGTAGKEYWFDVQNWGDVECLE